MLKAYRIADIRYPLFDGGGAQIYGGRWNSPGRRIIYAARNFAGALLEILVHTGTGRIPKNYHYIEISIPDTVGIENLDTAAIPDWQSPGSSTSRSYSDDWYDTNRTLILTVPSIVSQLEQNILINQNHPDFGLLEASNPQPVRWDKRLFQ